MERVNFHENGSSLPEELPRDPGHGGAVPQGVREAPAGAGGGQGQARAVWLKEWLISLLKPYYSKESSGVK